MPEFFYTTAKNNQARPSEYFRTVPVAGSLGADIYDIDLNNLSDEWKFGADCARGASGSG